jgi:hypothetical protein
MEIARSEFPVARHDHVFVYDVETGVLVDDIGWTDENGGSAFRDYANIDRYGPPAQTAEISGNVYFSVRDAFEAVSEHFGYQLFNDATVRGPVEASKAVVSVVTQPLKCAHALSAPRREAAILELMKCSLFVVSEAREASGRLEHSDSYNRPGFDSKNLRLLVNCQLWARQFVEALKKGDEMFSPSIDFSTLEGLVDQQVAYVRGLLAAGRKATREQFDEFNSLSERYGKEFDRLRAEILAMTDDARKRECLQRLVSINGRIGKELDPLLDQAERKGLFKNLSGGSSPPPKPVAKPEPISGHGAAVAFAESFFAAMKRAVLSESASKEEMAVDGLGRFFVDGGWGSGSSGGERGGNGENARRNRTAAEQALLGIVLSEGRISVSFSSGDERDRAAFAEKAREILPAPDAALEGPVVWAEMSVPGMEDAGSLWVAMKLVGKGGGWAIQMLRVSERRDPLRIDWNPG